MKQPSAKHFKLAKLQRLTGEAIMRPLTSKGSMQSRWCDGSSMTKLVEQIIKPSDKCSSFERLEIYNRQYWFRLLDSLIDDFPGVRSLIGEAKFDKLSEAYLLKHPSKSYTIRDLGINLAAFIKKNPRYAKPKTKLVYDMARLEWARIVAFDGPAAPVATMEEMARLGANKLKLGLQPYVTLLELEYPVDELSLKLKKVEALRTEAGAGARAKRKFFPKLSTLRKERRYVVVHRVSNAVYFKNLEPVQFYILAAICEGKTIQQACDCGLRRLPARERKTFDPQKLQDWFRGWASLGWFCNSRNLTRSE